MFASNTAPRFPFFILEVRLKSIISKFHFVPVLAKFLMIDFPLSLFAPHIARVIKGCPEKKMLWIHAAPIIAFVTDINPIRYFSMMDLPRNTVRNNGFISIVSFCINLAVAIVSDARLPFPAVAFVSDLHFKPESFFKSFGSASHNIVIT